MKMTKKQSKQIHLQSRKWRNDAEKWKNSTYSKWTFFDTNCLSELVKISSKGETERIHRFVKKRDIIIPSTVIQELSRAPEICKQIPLVLSSANLYLVSHPTKFWKCDLWNFINVLKYPRNVLETYIIPSGFFEIIYSHPDFIDAGYNADKKIERGFFSQIQMHSGGGIDEQKLGALIWGKVNEEAKAWLNLQVPVADCRPENFPSFYVYYYSYYFRYLTNKFVNPKHNDFNDLAHTILAPYCKEFYTERTLSQLLKREVKGRVPPNPFSTTKKLYKEGFVNKHSYQEARNSQDMRKGIETPLLQNTLIFSLSEMRREILN